MLEFVDLPLPNHPVARSRFTARLLLLEKIFSSLLPLLLAFVWLADGCEAVVDVLEVNEYGCSNDAMPMLFLVLLWF